MSMWKIVVQICLPIPLVLLALLCVPAPRVFHRGVLRVVDQTLGISLINSIQLLHFMLVVTGAALLATMRSTHQLSETKLDASTMTPNVLSANLGKRWRAERNFWISFITFTLWCLLARFYTILKQKARVEDELATLKGRGPAKTGADAPTKPGPSVPVVPAVPLKKKDPLESKKV
ncbi:g10292 [Coccomyxa viridis]|uniref:G10292 protein n=1 Tax=Coccomyxa viridis TaxID=1274662 RepID=A0ABP1G509_9CHLO